jgi:hypothetical protein
MARRAVSGAILGAAYCFSTPLGLRLGLFRFPGPAPLGLPAGPWARGEGSLLRDHHQEGSVLDAGRDKLSSGGADDGGQGSTDESTLDGPLLWRLDFR